MFSRKKKRGANNSADHHHRHHHLQAAEEVFRMDGHEAVVARLSLDGAKAHHLLKQSFMKKLEEERINIIKTQKQEEEEEEEEEEGEFGIGSGGGGYYRSSLGPTHGGMIRSNVDMVSQLHARPAKQPMSLPKCISLGVPSAQDEDEDATRYCCHHAAASPIVVVPPPRFFHQDDDQQQQQRFGRHQQQLCCGGDMVLDYDENLNDVVVGETQQRRSFPRSRSWGSRVMAWGLKNNNYRPKGGVPVIPSPAQGHHYHHHNPSSTTTTTPYHYY